MFQDYNADDIREIAQAYDKAPEMDIRALEGWLILGSAALEWRRKLEAQGLTVIESDDPEPYPDHTALFDDIAHNSRMVVSRANSEHPIWNVDTNVAFRVWHDMCHYNSMADFALGGELAACSRQAGELLSVYNRPSALCALYTECIGQLAYRLDRGEFGPQKVAYLVRTN